MAIELTEQQLVLALAMVDRSGRQMCPQEWDDSFDEYADQARATSRLPGLDAHGVRGDTSAGVLDAGIVLGIGLALLGRVAVHVLSILVDHGIEQVADLGTGRLHLKWRRRHGGKEGPAGGGVPPGLTAADLDALADRLAARIVPAVQTDLPQVPAADLRIAIRIQLDVLAPAPGAARDGRPADGARRPR